MVFRTDTECVLCEAETQVT